MKNKVLIKIALILLMMIIVIANMSVCFAEGEGNFNFENFENKVADDSIKTPVEKVVGTILSIIRIVGTGVAIIILAYFGMKYMMAAPGERADFKKGAMQYVVGAIIVFGASNILTFLIPLINRLLA